MQGFTYSHDRFDLRKLIAVLNTHDGYTTYTYSLCQRFL